MTGRVRRWLAVALVALATLGAAVVWAGPASAQATGRIIDVREQSGTLRVVFSADGLAGESTVDPASVQVSIDDQDVPASAQLADQTNEIGRRVSVLAMDVSGSMRGPGITGARAAATAFLRAVPSDVLVGLVTFSDRAQVRVRPTADRAQVQRAINGLEATGGTALYAGAAAAVDLAGTQGVRSVIVLSDGAEDGSSGSTTLQKATAKISAAKVKVDAVSLTTATTKLGPLKQLATAGSGSVVETTRAGDLTRLFQEVAKSLTNQLVVSIQVPAELAGRSTNVTVSAVAEGERLSDTVFATLSAAKPTPTPSIDSGPKPVQPSSLSQFAGADALPIAMGLVFAGLIVLLFIALAAGLHGDNQNSGMRRRLAVYTLSARKKPVQQSQHTSTSVLGDSAVARSAMELAGRVAAQRGFEERLALKFEAAGVPLRPAEWILIHAGIALGSMLLLFLLLGGSLLGALVGLVAGGLLPMAYLSVKQSRRSKAFLSQLPDSLQLLAGSLTAGYSLPQGVDTIVREGQQPIAGEFNRVLVEARLGAPIEDALEGVAERMRSTDFSWVVMAIRIQREVGGNLAEVLTTVSATLREREFLRRHVKALSAEGRLSAWILCLLPPGFMLYLTLVRPEYLKPLVTDFFGLVMLGFSVVLMAVGIFWMRKVIRVEV